MEIMKKLFFNVLLMSVGISFARPNFEICNQTKEKIFYTIMVSKEVKGIMGSEVKDLEKSPLSGSLAPNKWAQYSFRYPSQEEATPEDMIIISITNLKDETVSFRLVLYRDEPITTVFIKIIKDKNNYRIEAQKPRRFFEFTSKTCGGLQILRKANIADVDIQSYVLETEQQIEIERNKFHETLKNLQLIKRQIDELTQEFKENKFDQKYFNARMRAIQRLIESTELHLSSFTAKTISLQVKDKQLLDNIDLANEYNIRLKDEFNALEEQINENKAE